MRSWPQRYDLCPPLRSFVTVRHHGQGLDVPNVRCPTLRNVQKEPFGGLRMSHSHLKPSSGSMTEHRLSPDVRPRCRHAMMARSICESARSLQFTVYRALFRG